VAAFGWNAGFCGAGLAVKSWVWSLEYPDGEPLPSVAEYTNGRGYYNNEKELLDQVQNDLSRAARMPRILIIGALGRCGKGAVEFCEKVGIPSHDILRWDMEETARGGPFKEITDSDILINCIYLDRKIPKFVDMQSLAVPDRKLSVVCDVSCDTTVS
jgi:saccharopine dehydrogenase (NAD+, L-lysine forming)